MLRQDEDAALLYKTAAALNLCLVTKQKPEKEDAAFEAFLLDEIGRVPFIKEPFSPPTKPLFDKEQRLKAITTALFHADNMFKTLGLRAKTYHCDYALLITQHALTLYTPSERYEALLQQRANYLNYKMNYTNLTPRTADYEEAFESMDELVSKTSNQQKKGALIEYALIFLSKSIDKTLSSYLKALETCLDLIKRHTGQTVPLPLSVREKIYEKAVEISEKALTLFGKNLSREDCEKWHDLLEQALKDQALTHSSFTTTGRLASMLCETALLCKDTTLIASLLYQGACYFEQAEQKIHSKRKATDLVDQINEILKKLNYTTEHENNDHQSSQNEVTPSAKELKEFHEKVKQQKQVLKKVEIIQEVIYTNNRFDEFDECTINRIEDLVKRSPFITEKKQYRPKHLSRAAYLIAHASTIKDNAQAALLKKFLRYVTTFPRHKRLFCRKGDTLSLTALPITQELEDNWQEYHDDLITLILIQNPVACAIIDTTSQLEYQEKNEEFINGFFQNDAEEIKIWDHLLTPFLRKHHLPEEKIEEIITLFTEGKRITALKILYKLLDNKEIKELPTKQPTKKYADKLKKCTEKINKYDLEQSVFEEIDNIKNNKRALLNKKRCSLLIQTQQLPTFKDYWHTFEAFNEIAQLQDEDAKEFTLPAAQNASEILCEMLDMLGDEILGETQEQEALLLKHTDLFERLEKIDFDFLPQVKGLILRKEITDYLGDHALSQTGHILVLKIAYDTHMKELVLQEKHLSQLLNNSVFKNIQAIDDQFTGNLQATKALRLTRDKNKLESDDEPQEAKKLRSRLSTICSEAPRLYDLYFLRCFGGEEPEHNDYLRNAQAFKNEADNLGIDLLKEERATGYKLESIRAANKVTQRCLLLFQSATYHMRAINILGEQVAMEQLSDAVSVCLEGYQLAKNAEKPLVQAQLTVMSLTLLQKILEYERTHEQLRDTIISQANIISNES